MLRNQQNSLIDIDISKVYKKIMLTKDDLKDIREIISGEFKTQEPRTREIIKDEFKTQEPRVREIFREEFKTQEPRVREIIKEELKAQEPKFREVVAQELSAHEPRFRDIMREESSILINERVFPLMNKMITNSEEGVINKLREEITLQLKDFKRDLHSELKVEFGRTWEELKFIRRALEEHNLIDSHRL